MKKVVIWGIGGHMGRQVRRAVEEDPELELIGGVDAAPDGESTVRDPRELRTDADVVIDFSRAAALDDVLAYALANGAAVILAATGYDAGQLRQIKAAAARIPVLQSGNLSLGVNLMTKLVEQAARALGGGYDIEIVEAHHRRKADSPSGTAKMLVDAAQRGRADLARVQYGRHAADEPRRTDEIGVHSLRGGTIVGEHTVVFAGPDEIVEIKHTALSRAIFAGGAVRAAKILPELPPALYTMKEILSAKTD